MSKFIEISLKDGSSVNGNVLVKTINLLIVRTDNNKYLMISRDSLSDPEQFKFRD